MSLQGVEANLTAERIDEIRLVIRNNIFRDSAVVPVLPPSVSPMRSKPLEDILSTDDN